MISLWCLQTSICETLMSGEAQGGKAQKELWANEEGIHSLSALL